MSRTEPPTPPPILPPDPREEVQGPSQAKVQGSEVLQAFFLFFLLSFAVAQLMRFAFPTEEGKPPVWQLAAAQIPIHLIIVFAILRFRLFRGGVPGLAALGWTTLPSPLKGFAKGLLWYIPMGFSWWTLTILYMIALKGLGVAPPKQAVLQIFLQPGIPLYALVLLWTTTCISAPFAEEFLFRGSLFSWLRTKFSFWPAAFITAVAFALPHGGWKFLVPLGYLAIMLAWLREKTGSIWPSIGLHAAHNFVTLMLVTLVSPPEGAGFLW